MNEIRMDICIAAYICTVFKNSLIIFVAFEILFSICEST